MRQGDAEPAPAGIGSGRGGCDREPSCLVQVRGSMTGSIQSALNPPLPRPIYFTLNLSILSVHALQLKARVSAEVDISRLPWSGVDGIPSWSHLMSSLWNWSYSHSTPPSQYARDTLALTGAAYLMEAVEGAAKLARGGAEDAVNKMLGGVAAGGLLGVLCEYRFVGCDVQS